MRERNKTTNPNKMYDVSDIDYENSESQTHCILNAVIKFIAFIVCFFIMVFVPVRIGSSQLHASDETIVKSINARNYSSKMTKTKVFVTGYGHSATTHIMQFIGDVILKHNDSFYLFEFLHRKSFHLFVPHYNFTKQTTKAEARAKILSKLFDCDFPDLDYCKLEKYHLITMFNSGIEGNATKQSLEKKCLSSKHLVFKEIHFRHHTEYYQTMYDQHPNLRIFAMIRNPITHIPSIHRMPAYRSVDVGYLANQLCIKQLESIKYESSKWSAPQYNLIKMEDYFAKIKSDFNQTIVGFNQILQPGVSVNEMGLMNAIQRFVNFESNQWKIGRKNPVESYKNEDLEYITNHCTEFAKFSGYTLKLNSTHLLL